VKTKELIIITGATSGIGRSTAIELSNKGYPLLIIGRRLEKLVELNLPNTLCKEVDVTNKEAFRAAVNEAIGTFGPVGCLINNAGLMLLGQVGEQSPEEWSKMFDVNVIGMLNGIDLVLPEMKKRNTGTIINISSIAGKKSFPNHTVYCGTKFAVHGISETLREEVSGNNIRVITIAPGAVETELLGHTTSQEIKDGYGAWKEAMGGVLKAEDIAHSISFVIDQPQNVCIRELVIAATKQGA
jgi:NADP-dependent 3-hydroxy acid dehydrogenase YdfG